MDEDDGCSCVCLAHRFLLFQVVRAFMFCSAVTEGARERRPRSLPISDKRASCTGSRRDPTSEKSADGAGDFLMMGFEREVTGVEETDLSVDVVALERFCAGRKKKRIVLAPDGKKGRPRGTEILLKLGIQGDVARVVEKEVELDLVDAGTSQKRRIQFVRFRRNEGCLRDSVRVLPLRGLGGKKLPQSSAILGRGLLPIFLDGVPALAQALFVSVAILGNDRRDALGISQGEAEADGNTIVEYVDRVATETDGLRKAIDDRGEIAERVAKVLAVRCI